MYKIIRNAGGAENCLRLECDCYDKYCSSNYYNLVWYRLCKGYKAKYAGNTILCRVKPQFAIDYAKLYFSLNDDIKLKDGIDWTDEDKKKLDDLYFLLIENDCDWGGFCENVLGYGVDDFVERLRQNTDMKTVMNHYV